MSEKEYAEYLDLVEHGIVQQEDDIHPEPMTIDEAFDEEL